MAVQATDAAGAAQVDAFVVRRRAEVARLALAARSARQRCIGIESELSSVADPGADQAPADLLGVVDVMLEKAVGASELAVASAEREAAYLLQGAVADGSEILRRAGLDPDAVLPTPRAAAATRSITPPPTAVDLWRDTRRSILRSSGGPPVTGPDPVRPAAPVGPPVSQIAAATPNLEPRASAGEVTASTLDIATMPFEQPITALGPDHASEVHDTFWQELPGDRRVRDRLRRRSSKEGA